MNLFDWAISLVFFVGISLLWMKALAGLSFRGPSGVGAHFHCDHFNHEKDKKITEDHDGFGPRILTHAAEECCKCHRVRYSIWGW